MASTDRFDDDDGHETQHDEGLHERFHLSDGDPRKISMPSLMRDCPACRAEADEEDASE